MKNLKSIDTSNFPKNQRFDRAPFIMSALTIVNAKKNYASTQALKGINLKVAPGEFFGLLGPNGAGKSTLIHSIVGLAHLNQGSIQVYGHDVRRESLKTKSLVGFAPQEVNLDRFFSIRKILMYQAGFFGIPRQQRRQIVDELLEQFDLTEKADIQYYRLSGGMQKRLLVAKAMIGNPQLIILDEPTAGVDVEQRHALWKYLRKLNQAGATIILTTHYIDEAEALCERIGIINLGEIKELGSPQDLIQKYCQRKVVLETSQNLDKNLFENLKFNVAINGTRIEAWGKRMGEMTSELYALIQAKTTATIEDIHVERGSLEEVFLKVTGEKITKK